LPSTDQGTTCLPAALCRWRLEEMMAAKRKLARQRNIFARLLKEKMGR
jgi:hypothetical protein